ncbi:unnamed protein product [Leptidea sinapis]|uniref:Uncharacterized protein n=1 Tax=Leptidea sinapis TaxID=189913 RepID=A0A5E4QP10_9NEOP|nr:unnamed protein product [Leptidea sinapis]
MEYYEVKLILTVISILLVLVTLIMYSIITIYKYFVKSCSYITIIRKENKFKNQINRDKLYLVILVQIHLKSTHYNI